MLYRQLRRINPSPYLFFLRMGESVLIGSSPEILFRLQGAQIDLRGGRDAREAYAEASATLDALAARIRGPRPAGSRNPPVRAPMELERSMTPEAYQEAVKRAKEYVVAGDIFQVVLGLRFSMPRQVEPLMLYRRSGASTRARISSSCAWANPC